MFQEAPGFEQRLSDLQAQIDRLTIALQLWRDSQERLVPADERLSGLAEDAADILDEWQAIGARHARAVDALEQQVAAFGAVEARLHAESADRFLTLQRMVQQEWATQRLLPHEASGARREQVAELTHACVVAASGRVPAAPVTSLPSDERDLLEQFASVVVTAPVRADHHSAEVEGSERAAPAADLPLHPELDAPEFDVSEQHEPRAEVWDFAPVEAAAPQARRQALRPEPQPVDTSAPDLRGEMASQIAEMRLLLRESEERMVEQAERQHRTNARVMAVVGVALLLVVTGGGWWMASIQARLRATERQLESIRTNSARQVAQASAVASEARADAARLADVARQASMQAEAMTIVLASPDLVRYGLTATSGSSASAQLLWSRSRGLVVSAVRLDPPPAGSAYQVWLLTQSSAIGAGMLRVDERGRGSLATIEPPVVPRPVLGASITLEPAVGSPAPTGPTVAARLPVPAEP
ncbi:MAG: anti-sigma factor [Acidobacteria bacterium]|nr:anti-sigma factor [Acidobacteriota bacterium]